MNTPSHSVECTPCTTTSQRPCFYNNMAGLSYVEVLVAVALISITLLPAIEALYPAVQGTELLQSRTELHYHLTARLEEVLAEPFADLDAEAQSIGDPTVASVIYSDATATPDRRLVFLSRYDADNTDGDADFFTGIDEGLIWIRVEIEGTDQAIERLTSQYD